MKRLIFILSLIILFLISGCHSAICEKYKEENLSLDLDFVHLIQSINLIYIDVFLCTKSSITKEGRKEANPVSKFFTDKNMYNELFLGAVTLNFFAYKITFTRQYYIISLAIIEIWAISTWEKHNAEFFYFIKF